MILLETERLFLREWVPDDWKRYKPLATDPRVLRYVGRGEPSPDERIKAFVEGGIELAKKRGWILWPVIHRDDAELIGFCGFADGFPPAVEIGWRLKPEYWGQGLATEIAGAVMEYGWRRFQFDRLIAVIQPANQASIRVAEKLGMTLETTFTHQGIEVLRYAKANPRMASPGVASSSIIIRRAGLADLPAITEIYNEAILTTTATFDTEPKTVDERLHWFQSHGERHPVIVAILGGRIVGWASISRWSERPAYDDTAETSFYVKSEVRGQGIGRRLKEAVVDEARRLRFHSLIARVAEGSDASLHLNESFGFVRVGTLREVGRKFGRLLDVHVLQKILD